MEQTNKPNAIIGGVANDLSRRGSFASIRDRNLCLRAIRTFMRYYGVECEDVLLFEESYYNACYLTGTSKHQESNKQKVEE